MPTTTSPLPQLLHTLSLILTAPTTYYATYTVLKPYAASSVLALPPAARAELSLPNILRHMRDLYIAASVFTVIGSLVLVLIETTLLKLCGLDVGLKGNGTEGTRRWEVLFWGCVAGGVGWGLGLTCKRDADVGIGNSWIGYSWIAVICCFPRSSIL
jgi:hypothetical protein